MRFWPVVAWVVFVVLAGGAAGMWLLGVWSPLPSGVADPEQLRLDRIKTGLTVAAGLAAGVTLLMTLRRQGLSERAQRFAEQAQRFAETEALEQRTTALYVAAADQLASDKAAVRVAGLYVLERLGQDNPKLRQTVFDVWCAYLRMPYSPPLSELLPRDSPSSPALSEPDGPSMGPKEEAERRQEFEVRLTAQSLLTTHLRIGAGDKELSNSYWLAGDGTRLSVNLTGAALVDFDLYDCRLGGAEFRGAQFHGDADLRRVRFHGRVNLRGVLFHGNARLLEAEFHGDATLKRAQFHGRADLSSVQFYRNGDLSEAEFHGDAILQGAQFKRDADLRRAEFHGFANLSRVQFHRNPKSLGAQFHGKAYLLGVQTDGNDGLDGATFHHEGEHDVLDALDLLETDDVNDR